MRWPVFSAIVPELVPRTAVAGGAGPQRRVDERVAHHRAAGGRRDHRGVRQRLGVRAQRGPVADGGLRHHALAARAQGKPAGPRAAGQRDAGRPAVRVAIRRGCARSCCASRCSSFTPPPCWRCCRWSRAPCPAARPAPSPCCWRPWASGAIVAALAIVRIRGLMPLQQLLFTGTVLQSVAMIVVAFTPNIYVAVPAMFCAGHRLDHGGQFAHRVGPDGAARLGARPRHVDLSDGLDGLHRGRGRRLGPGGDLDRHPSTAWPSPP